MANDLSFFERANLPDCNGRATCAQPPVCPACGGLECLCRPRFFAGQLLSEQDLNRLDHYIVAKNRLHNRYLVGWGVACGLEVVCNICGPDQGSRSVVVKPGYALSPCGNDIIVCKGETVDVCALIDACRPPRDDCQDFLSASHDAADGKDECDGGTEDWILAVCYVEKPSRGVAAMLRAAAPAKSCGCTGGCGCTGDCGGQCGCGKAASGHGKGASCGCGNGKPAAPDPNKASALPEQCEPTLTCEGYRFVAYKAPKKDSQKRAYGEAARRFLCCILPLFEELGADAADGAKSPRQAIQWVHSLRDAIRDFIVNEGFYDCRIAAKLAAVSIPSHGTGDALYAALNQSAYGILDVGRLVVQKCLCAALLPPCPEPSAVDCVPLATVTVSRGPCRVSKICNIAARKFLVTWPNVQYWLSLVNLFSGGQNGFASFRAVLERLCCTTPEARYDADKLADVDLFRMREGAHEEVGAAPRKQGFGDLLFATLAHGERKSTVEDLLLAALGARDAEGQPFASPEELANPAEFIVLNQVVAPVLKQLTPRGALAAFAAAASRETPDDAARMETLERQVIELAGKVERQDRTIEELRKRKR
jgi:hypothetical protein